ncbi:MAG: hypothetical protein JKY60_03250, partial [Kordiimonadaceae bacterium]|nr:hypothetical protein [Kordiimonadaceae bacterium]
GGEGRADESSGSVARSIESQLQSNTGPPPTFGEILINAEDLDAENMNVLTRDVQLLTNPKPSPPIVLDDTNENAENYLRQQHESQVRSVVQQYFSDKAGRFGASYGVSEWYTAATGLSDPGPISLTKFLLSEAERRYTSLQWHGEQKHANLAIMMREQNTMLAFELFLRSHEFRQQERANDLLATQLSLELNK